MNDPSSCCNCPATSCTGQCAQLPNDSRTGYFTGQGCPMMNSFNYGNESTPSSYYWTFPSAVPYPHPAAMSFDFSAGSFFPQYNQPFPYYPSCARVQPPSMGSFSENTQLKNNYEENENDILIPASTPDSVEHWSPPPDSALWKDHDNDGGLLADASNKNLSSVPHHFSSSDCENMQGKTSETKNIELLMPLRETSHFESRVQKIPHLQNSFSLPEESMETEFLDDIDSILPLDQPNLKSLSVESSIDYRSPIQTAPFEMAKEIQEVDLEMESMPVLDSSILVSPFASRSPAFKTEKDKKKRQSPLNRDVFKQCSNCGATESTLWRRTGQGLIECNPCQLHFRRHGQKRPLTMKSAKILRRVRQPRVR